ncbi:MAG: hypothetical protein IH945_09060 [Armatimonadetes bacterium]|nr:hypothetical protein [Armatimonadota bacterium]
MDKNKRAICLRLAYEIPFACLLAIMFVPIRSAAAVNPAWVAPYSRYDVLICTVLFMFVSGIVLQRIANPGLLRLAIYSLFLFAVSLFLLVATPYNI